MIYCIRILSILMVLVIILAQPTISSGEITPDSFTGNDGLLDEAELIGYFLVKKECSYKEVHEVKVSDAEVAAEHGNEKKAKEKKRVIQTLIQMREILGVDSPYTPEQVNAYQEVVSRRKSSKEKKSVVDIFKKTCQKEGSNWEFGPVELRQKFEDWDKKAKDVKGADISYVDDKLDDKQTWITQGSIIFPIRYSSENKNEGDNRTSHFNYSDYAILPAIKWNYLEMTKNEDKNTQELTIQLPLYMQASHKIEGTGDTSVNPTGLPSWRSELYLTPYFSTDFDVDGKLIGASLTYEPIVQVGEQFQTGSWQSIAGGREFAYLFRVIPGIHYNYVLSEGKFISREKNDDTLGTGLSLELGFKPFGKESSWDIRAGYDLLYDFTGESDGYFDKWTGSLSYWFTTNTGLTIKYEQGDQFLTKREIDLITLGLQIRN